MKVKFGKVVMLLFSLAAVISFGTVTASATETDTTSYGYLAGQAQNSSRHAQFESAASMTTDAQREAFFAAQGIGEGSAYSTAEHLDAQELVEAGILDQATADRITAFSAQKHDTLQAKFAGKSEMTPEDRHSFYESFQDDGTDGDTVSELLNAGIITQEQADAINAYLSK